MGSFEVSSQINFDRDVLGFDDFSVYAPLSVFCRSIRSRS